MTLCLFDVLKFVCVCVCVGVRVCVRVCVKCMCVCVCMCVFDFMLECDMYVCEASRTLKRKGIFGGQQKQNNENKRSKHQRISLIFWLGRGEDFVDGGGGSHLLSGGGGSQFYKTDRVENRRFET